MSNPCVAPRAFGLAAFAWRRRAPRPSTKCASAVGASNSQRASRGSLHRAVACAPDRALPRPARLRANTAALRFAPAGSASKPAWSTSVSSSLFWAAHNPSLKRKTQAGQVWQFLQHRAAWVSA